MRSLALMFAGLIISVAAVATMAGCAPAADTGQAYACPPGVPWVPGGYANAKFVPGHCQGEAAK